MPNFISVGQIEQGRNRKERVKVIDFNDPAFSHNQFLAVTQLWIPKPCHATR